MQGERINALNEGLRTFKEELNRDSLANKRVEVAIVTFNTDVQVVQDFVTADQFEPPMLVAQGLTHTGSAIHEALDMIEARKNSIAITGIILSWVFLITDGEPQGESDAVVEQAAQRIKDEENKKRVAFFAGVEGTNMTRLSEIVVRSPLQLKGLNFQEMFIWLSASMQRVSQSKPDDDVPLSPPGWGIV